MKSKLKTKPSYLVTTKSQAIERMDSLVRDLILFYETGRQDALEITFHSIKDLAGQGFPDK